jgi:Xaa-Pro aminopeptidase
VSSEEQKQADNRARPTTDEFRTFVADGWAPRRPGATARSEAARYAVERRARVSEAFKGERLIVPAGGLKVRSNDTDCVFRPHSAFAHLTGLGGDREPDAVLMLEPLKDGGHEAILFFVRSLAVTPRSSSPTPATASSGSAPGPPSRTSRPSSA